MRSPFGWDLPPGISHRMIEEAQIQDDDEQEVEVTPPNASDQRPRQ